MSSVRHVEVVADVSRNALKLSFIGAISPADMKQYESDIARALQSLQPGFSLLSDLTELTEMDLGCVPFIEKGMDLARASGVKLVVRIIPDQTKDIGMSIMSLFHYPRELKIVTTGSRDAAKKILH